jgi:hypothetical protein
VSSDSGGLGFRRGGGIGQRHANRTGDANREERKTNGRNSNARCCLQIRCGAGGCIGETGRGFCGLEISGFLSCSGNREASS